MAAYATDADLATWLGTEAPSDSARLLARASTAVDTFLIGVQYVTDDNQMPTDTVVMQGMNDATCAQVEWWLATQDELGLHELDHEVSVTIAGIATKRTPGRRARLCQRSREILQLAILSPAKPGVSVWG